MFPRSQRITKAADFESIFAGGRAYQATHLTLRVLAHAAPSRFGFIVGKRVSVKATLRNRTRRRLRAAALGLAPAVKKTADIVIIAKSGSAGLSQRDLSAELTTLFNQAKLAS